MDRHPANGVLVYDGTRVVTNISQAKYLGYRGAICRKVVRGKPNEIWVATNYGIDKIKYHLGDSLVIDNITPLNMADGLCSDDVNDILIADSLIYVATSQGLTIFNENQMIAAAAVPIYISAIRINDKDSMIREGEYNLTYQQNNLRIEYIGISLPSAGYLRYQYRLLGSGNDKWTTTTNTSIEFRSLSPGSYTFEAAVLDKFGNQSKSLASVKFRITPAFYMTIWFWALMVIIILTIGFYIIRARFRRQQRQFEKEQNLNNKIIELEQQALKAQMNPHFIFNCLTAVQHFVNKEDLYSANMYLSNFAKLIRKTLDLSGEQYISLDKEVSYLQNYVQLEKMRFQEKFQYVISVDPDIDQYAVEIPPMLLQPIIENAIRHGLRNMHTNTGMLIIDFSQTGNKIICNVDDNGVGMKRAKELKTTMHVEYQSKGMSLTMSRIQAINMISDKKITLEIKDKYDNNNEASGTLFTLSFEQ
ncbi:MAG: putative signal transduction histidine kinase [Bacteroidetes bacterium]|nr:putative signal transduction histidine kinase [Bacteroidota bacterium]